MAEKAKILSDEDQLLKDGLENLVAQLGTEQDKRSHSTFVNKKQLSLNGNEQELNALYRTDWLSGKVVDIIPDDMTREWRDFDGDIDPDKVKILKTEEDRLALRHYFNLGHKWGRLYGTAYIIMSIDDGQTPDMPLNINTIKPGGLKHIKVIDRHRINHAEVQPIVDPFNSNFGFPLFYRINETSIKVHHSRVLRFDGVLLPYDEFKRNNYNSDSVLDRLYEAITNLNTVTHGAASMVYETNVDIIKVKGLMGYLQTADGEELLRKRFTLAGMLKSFNNLMLLDNEEDFDTKSNSFSGLPDLINRFAQLVSAATDIPATRLLGVSSSGFNATGEGDLKNYYDMIRSKQYAEYKPKLDYFDKIMSKSLGLSDDDELTYNFKSLFQMTPKEQADTDFVNAQRDTLYLDADIVTEAAVAKDLKQKGTYTNITDEDIEALEDINDLEDFSNDLDTNTGADTDNEEIEEEIEEGSSSKNPEES